MKTKSKLIIPNLVIAACICFSFSGCETLKTIYTAGTADINLSASGDTGIVHDDQIVVRTEQALRIALSTFDLFLKLEYDNRDLFSNIPKAHETAEYVRRNGKQLIFSANTAKNAYKGNRTAQNHANLMSAYRGLKSALDESKKFISKVQ